MSKFVLTTQIQLGYPAARANGQDRRRRQAHPPAPNDLYIPCLPDPDRHGECDQNGGYTLGCRRQSIMLCAEDPH